MPQNFVRRLEAAARRFADRPAIVWDGGTLTYHELDARAGGFARFLAARGVKAGQRVALDIPNRWPFPVAFLGTLKLGATVAPIDTRLTAAERQTILADLVPAVVAHEVIGDEAEWPTADPADGPALILYTSGSTGRPKGAVLSHGALAFAIESWADPVMALTADDVVLAVLPFSHSYGLNGALLAPLLTGAHVVLLERFAPDAVIAAIRDHRVTVFPGVATMFRRLLDTAGFGRQQMASVRTTLSGAAPCDWPLAEEWRERTGVKIVRGYGMTELFRPISYLAREPIDRGEAIGRPVPGVEVRIVDDAGRARPAGEAGELWIRSPAAMDGYLGAPEDTRAVLVDGWFRTGDIATLTPEGLVRIEGRKRERILRGGYSIFPGEIETVLCAHPDVAEAAVIGEPHAELGEEVVAFVTLKPGSRVDAEALVAWGKERLAAFKYPRRVTIVDQLPKGPTGKVLKSKLRASG